nr:uncharacterized protein LOC129257926 [Lytechinus pictus]XP_054752343.1 uncharacterized protein LOC129257926 [Lytechinus pictus]
MTTTAMLQKRKRDKAQEQLRGRMRQRREGPGTSSTLLQTRRRNAFRDTGKLSGGMANQPPSLSVTPGDLLGSNYTSWQPKMSHSSGEGGVVSDRMFSQVKGVDPVPMGELIKRVLQRKVDNLELGSTILPLGSVKSRHIPYAVRHSSHVKKIVGTMSKQKAKENVNKSVVVVDNKETDARSKQRLLGSHAKVKNPLKPLRLVDCKPSLQDDPIRCDASKISIKTDEPRTSSSGQSYPNLIVTRVKETSGAKVAVQHRDSRKQTLNKTTMQQPKPLPSIQSTTSGKLDKISTSRLLADAVIKSKTRCSSGDDIINLKTAQSEAIQKLEDMGQPTLLGTPRRFTHRMVRFKSNLGKVDKLSAIQEDKGLAKAGKQYGLKETPSISGPRSAALKGILSNAASVSERTADVG